jgi:hypothetical protein
MAFAQNQPRGTTAPQKSELLASSATADNAADGSDGRADGSQRALRRVAMIAWLAILLGLTMQVLILIVKLALGAPPGAPQIAVDFVQGIAWSFFVCIGIGFGTAIAKVRSAIGGVIGAVSGPLAIGIAKGSQKAVEGALGVVAKPAVLSLMTTGGFRALEYGFLGWVLAWLATRPASKLGHFLLSGAAAGLVFGGSITLFTIRTAGLRGDGLTAAQIAAMALNELVFPMGCALVVYAALFVGQHISLIPRKD